ncbi:hypothetical protein BpHYR1_036296 [Brachionus plicatilis]|uniref:Uncharacterized protein n=1 Tax=Brachionus plicatilis TaxID=10195 RepID=A0A3M7Q7D9_BRAPC|nr:hypothetical protein BpHYR1_036296 [Brachionus plicatilis]
MYRDKRYITFIELKGIFHIFNQYYPMSYYYFENTVFLRSILQPQNQKMAEFIDSIAFFDKKKISEDLVLLRKTVFTYKKDDIINFYCYDFLFLLVLVSVQADSKRAKNFRNRGRDRINRFNFGGRTLARLFWRAKFWPV